MHNLGTMDDPTRLIRDSNERHKLKVSLPGGRYQLSLDNQAVILLTDDFGFSERDIVPDPIVPILVAMGDAWFPRERDVDQILDGLSTDGRLTGAQKVAVKSYLTSTPVQERNVERLLTVLDDSPIDSVSKDDLEIKSLPDLPSSLDPDADDEATSHRSPDATEGGVPNSKEAGSGEDTRDPVDFEKIPGIGPTRAEKLTATEASSLQEIADSRPSDIAVVSNLSEGIAAVAIEGARELVGQVKPMEERLAEETGISETLYESALSSLAAAGVPPSEAGPTLRSVYGPTVGDIDAVTGGQAYFLWEAGYQTPKDVVEASTEELERVYQLGSKTAPEIQDAARDLLSSHE